MQIADDIPHERIALAAAVIALHVVLGYALITDLGFHVVRTVQRGIKVFDVRQELPSPKIEPERIPIGKGAELAPATPASQPSVIVSVPSAVRLDTPPPVVAAPVPGLGAAAVGNGPGGSGAGSGRGGGGRGAGSGAGITSRAQQRAGRITGSDYPRAARGSGAEGTVFVRFAVDPDGRANDCVITRSSGNAELDSTTCRLIERRFRYLPARDAGGRPVPDVVIGNQQWRIDKVPRSPNDPP